MHRLTDGQTYLLILVLVHYELESRKFHAPISVQCLSSLFLNALVDGASTTSSTCCGNAFQQLITLMLKNDFRVPNCCGTSWNKQLVLVVNCGCLWPAGKISDCQSLLFLLGSCMSQSNLREVVFAAVSTIMQP